MIDGKSRKICCFGAKPCSIAIALIDFLFSLFSLLSSLNEIIFGINIPQNEDQIKNCYEQSTVYQLKNNPYVILLGSILGFIQCIILVIGILKKKPACLLVWLLINGIAVAVMSFMIFMAFLLLGAAALVLLVVLVLPLAFEIFGIWIVSEYREQMLDNQRILNQNRSAEL